MPRFRFVRLTPDELATGRPLAYGDEVELTSAEAEVNARPIDAGDLLALPDEAPARPPRDPDPTTSPDKETDQ